MKFKQKNKMSSYKKDAKQANKPSKKVLNFEKKELNITIVV